MRLPLSRRARLAVASAVAALALGLGLYLARPPGPPPDDDPPPRPPDETPAPEAFDPRTSPLWAPRICLAGCVEIAHGSRDYYLSWASEKEGPSGKERTIRGVHQVSNHCAICKTHLSPGQLPAGLASAAAPLLAAIDQLLPVATEAEGYYDREQYKDDRMATGRRLHAPLLAAYAAVDRAARPFRARALEIEAAEQESIKAPLYGPARALLDAGLREFSTIDPAALEGALQAFERQLKAHPPPHGSLRETSASQLAKAGHGLLHRRRSGPEFSAHQLPQLGTQQGHTVRDSPDALAEAYRSFASHNDLIEPCRHYRSQGAQ